MRNLRPLTADAASKLHVLRHDSDALGVDSAQLSVLKKLEEVGLGRLLKRKDSRCLKAWRVGILLRDFAHKPLKGELANQQLPRALKLANVAQGDRTKPVAALDRGLATGPGRPPSARPRQTSRRLGASRMTCRQLRPRHCGGREVQWREKKGGDWGAHEQVRGECGAVGRGVRRGERVGASQVTVGAAGAGCDTDQGWRGNGGGGGGGGGGGEGGGGAAEGKKNGPPPCARKGPGFCA